MSATYVSPGGGVHHRMLDGDHVAKASVAAADGGFELFEVHAPAGPAAPLHVSPWSGVLYVLEGTVQVQVDGEGCSVEPGGAVTLPAGVPCTFRVERGAARFLAITTGLRAGRFFAEAAAAAPAGTPPADAMAGLARVTARHGVALVLLATAGPAGA
ncbi:cupin domain-containing protein [Cellulomonas endophytica]|uniref:cupin domain-containing protein n=1 Tax=Cellulomonas endophytica TaxID=2494735 RepID=UPI001010A3AD|nr:cupin domain-containing protein [Cellulomonas endophytica]